MRFKHSHYKSGNRYKYYLRCHLIFVCKYRKKLLTGDIKDDIKKLLNLVASKSDFTIETMETDIDHIHLIMDYKPSISISSIVRKLKQESTYWIWRLHPYILNYHFWKEKRFWSDGYFACSIGEASTDTIRRYIESQG